MFSCRLHPLGQLPRSGQQAVVERGKVVAWVQDVRPAALALLLPHDVRAGREERPRALAVELVDNAGNAEHHPHRDHGEVWGGGGGAGGQDGVIDSSALQLIR